MIKWKIKKIPKNKKKKLRKIQTKNCFFLINNTHTDTHTSISG